MLYLTAIFRFLFRWLAIPWLQTELDTWTRRFNLTKRQAQRHKLLPQGVPNLIHAKPEQFGARNYMVNGAY
jgi:hypothetical protein